MSGSEREISYKGSDDPNWINPTLKEEVQKMAINVLDGFAADCYKLAYEKGFWEHEGNVREIADFWLLKKLSKLALITSEIGEAVEAVRQPAASNHIPDFTLEEEEMADILIRVFDYCGALNIRIGAAFVAKMEYNWTRPHKHGKEA